ncbi:MAG: hypothetical protein AAFP90_02460 [Planctomycetota bacterium]
MATLLELKMASGTTTVHRPRDLDNVIQLIRKRQLSLEFLDHLRPYVHETFLRLLSATEIEGDY